jgi:hypothetical protein
VTKVKQKLQIGNKWTGEILKKDALPVWQGAVSLSRKDNA